MTDVPAAAVAPGPPPLPPPRPPWQPNVAAIVLVGVFVVLPLTFFVSALAQLGVCYSSCSPGREAMVALLWLVPVGYAVAAVRFARRGRRQASAGPYATGPATWPWVLVAVLVAFSVLVVTCFAIVGVGG